MMLSITYCLFLALGVFGGDDVVVMSHYSHLEPARAEILRKCPQMWHQSYSAACPLGQVERAKPGSECEATKVTIRLQLEYFNGIDDVAESLHVAGSTRLRWFVYCPQYNITDHVRYYMDKSHFWSPRINHQNAVSNVGMSSAGGFTSRFLVELKPQLPGQFDFLLQTFGVFSSNCEFDMANYPFDTQNCDIQFLSQDFTQAFQFSESVITVTSDFLNPASNNWRFVSSSHRIVNVNLTGSRSQAIFNLVFQRNPTYFVASLMIPSAVLSGLQLFALAMDPGVADRPVFSITILLALTFLQSSILSRVPAKPHRIFIVNYTDMCAALAFSCTGYCLVSCGYVKAYKEWARVEIPLMPKCLRFTISRARLGDAIALSVALFFYLLIQIYGAAHP